jgi:hypothetical protein
MKLSTARIKQIIKEEVSKIIKLNERTLADVAAERGVVPAEDEEPMAENSDWGAHYGSIGRRAQLSGVGPAPPTADRAAELIKWHKSLAHRINLFTDADLDFKLDTRVRSRPSGRGLEVVYVLYVSLAIAAKLPWPEELGADDWELTWDEDYAGAGGGRGTYVVTTDIEAPDS